MNMGANVGKEETKVADEERKEVADEKIHSAAKENSTEESHLDVEAVAAAQELINTTTKQAYKFISSGQIEQAESLLLTILPPPIGSGVSYVSSSDKYLYCDFENDLEEAFFRTVTTDKRTLRRHPVSLLSAYSFYSFILVEKRAYDRALEVLNEGLSRCPLAVALIEEKSEIFKQQKRFNEVWHEVMNCWNYAYRPPAVAKCYRAWGFCLVEWQRWDEALAAFLTSMQYEPNNSTARNEIAYIASLRPGGLPDLSTFCELIPGLLEQAGIPLHPNQKWVDLALSLGEIAESQHTCEKAAFYYKLALDLTGNADVKRKLDECVEKASQQANLREVPKLSNRIIVPVNADTQERLED
jgi:tetratricopeptide (TPR) repeat protein